MCGETHVLAMRCATALFSTTCDTHGDEEISDDESHDDGEGPGDEEGEG